MSIMHANSLQTDIGTANFVSAVEILTSNSPRRLDSVICSEAIDLLGLDDSTDDRAFAAGALAKRQHEHQPYQLAAALNKCGCDSQKSNP